MKRKETARVISQERISGDICSLVLSVTFAGDVSAGQFVSLFPCGKEKLLPRPISVCAADAAAGTIRLVYRVAGKGTKEFSQLMRGDEVEVMGPLGHGFPLEEAKGKRVLLIGGGIGIPPLLFCAKALKGNADVTAAAGYRSDSTYLLEELEALCDVLVSTDDGSMGVHGTVLDAVRADGRKADLIFACGPRVMLRAVKEYAAERGIRAYVSMEERMACGVGVCLGCVCTTTAEDAHSHVHNARVCTEGPVFAAEEVDLS